MSSASTLFSATTGNHTLAAGGIVFGAGPHNISGTGELQITNANSFTGKTTVNAGNLRIGYCPHGISLPAWKAVMFNPKTDEAVLDRLIASIEEL